MIPFKFVSITCQSGSWSSPLASNRSSQNEVVCNPALATTMSICRHAFKVVRNRVDKDDQDCTSVRIYAQRLLLDIWVRGHYVPSAFSNWMPSSSFTSPKTTYAPCWCNSSTVARPIPLAPPVCQLIATEKIPVTIATLSLRDDSSESSKWNSVMMVLDNLRAQSLSSSNQELGSAVTQLSVKFNMKKHIQLRIPQPSMHETQENRNLCK